MLIVAGHTSTMLNCPVSQLDPQWLKLLASGSVARFPAVTVTTSLLVDFAIGFNKNFCLVMQDFPEEVFFNKEF